MRIGMIGHFGGIKTPVNGQTIKTMELYDAIQRCCPDIVIEKVDTYYGKKNPVKLCAQLLGCAWHCKKIIVLLSDKGRRVLFPILYLLCKAGKEIYHDSIAGQLAREAEENQKVKKYISAFKANWVESGKMAARLHELGVGNASFVPNFKNLPILRAEELPREYAEPYRFVTFSRVTAEKGIGDAIRSIQTINEQAGRKVAAVDIYGPIEPGYKQQFRRELQEAGDCCRYCGIIPANESVSVLQNYYALLFPTHCNTEGIPGTIIDAYCSGLPVIARRWDICDEVISDHKTGLVYDFAKPELLLENIRYAIEHPEEFIEMKAECLKAAAKYTEDSVMEYILKEIGIGDGK